MRNHVRTLALSLVALLCACALVLQLGAGAAHAEPPMRLEGYVTDTTGSVSASEAGRVERAVEQLRQETGAALYLVVVQRFDSPRTGNEWASQVAERSGLGGSDVILYVGLSAQEFGLNAAADFEATDAELRSIERRDIAPLLDRGQLADAGVAAADGLREALAGSGSGGSASGTGSGASSTAGAIGLLIMFLVLVAVIIAVLAWVAIARRRKAKRAREAVGQNLAEISSQAAQQLVQMDDQLATAEQEVGFAEAQFGQEQVAPFRAAIAEARAKTQHAFALQNQVLDHVPEPDGQRIEWSRQIIQLVGEAQARLAAEHERFRQLRDMERNAPELLRQIAARTEQLGHQVSAAHGALEQLRGRYEASALRPVDDAASHARHLLDLAIAETGSASEHLRQGRGGEAVVDIGDAQQAISNAEAALASIEHMRSQLAHAEQMIAAEIADMTPDIERLRGAGVVPGTDPGFAERTRRATTAAEQAILAARAPGASTRDPLTVLDQLRRAGAELDEVARASSEAQHRLEMLRRRFERTIDSARAKIRQCSDYVATHRGVVGEAPRARLRQAEDMLAQAEQRSADDIEWAAHTAQAAEQAASGALTQAMEEASRQAPPVHGYGGGGYRYASRGTSTEAIIGGIIGGILSSAGRSRRRGGFGGFSAGISAGNGLGGFISSGGFRPGGFSSSGGRR